MLVQFSVDNFKSFDSEQTLSMLASEGIDANSEQVLEQRGSVPPLLRTAAMYGANGAGKSAFVEAIDFARRLIVEGTRADQSIPVKPFRLRAGRDAEPSKMQFIFGLDGVLFTYGFMLVSALVHEEWLSVRVGDRDEMIFERWWNDDGHQQVDFGEWLTRNETDGEPFLDYVGRGTRRNQLFLTEAIDRNVQSLYPIRNWFEHTLFAIPAEPYFLRLESMVQENDKFRTFAEDVLNKSGTGISGIRAKRVAVDQYMEADDSGQSLHRVIAGLKIGQSVALTGAGRDGVTVTMAQGGRLVGSRMEIVHSGTPNDQVGFRLSEESDGTQRLLHLLPAIFLMRERGPRVLILDELDRRFHTALSRLLLDLVVGPGSGSQQSQLIYTTHDTNLLDLDFLRRDEIWFAEKDPHGASRLYSLAEFDLTDDIDVRRGYLNGRFGAIPFAGDVVKLGWLNGLKGKPVVRKKRDSGRTTADGRRAK